jgi:hypothetical protein
MELVRLRTSASELELPLLESSAEGAPEYLDTARAKDLVAAQETLYSAGLGLYSAGFLIDGIKDYSGNHDLIAHSKLDWMYLAFGVVQTVGLMAMAVANVDSNLHLRQRPMLALGVALAIIAYAGLRVLGSFSPESTPYSLPALPWLYLLLPCRFFVVLRADSEGLPRFSQLLLLSLVFNLLGEACSHLITASNAPPHSPHWEMGLINGLDRIVGAAVTALAYQIRRRQGDNMSLALNYSIFVYLLVYGTTMLAQFVMQPAMLHEPASSEGIGLWIFGPVHIVPAAVALAYRSVAYRWLGKRRLQAAAEHDRLEGKRILPTQGSIAEVEQAIAASNQQQPGTGGSWLDSFNAAARTDNDDDGGERYALLHLACWNGHSNAVKALLAAHANVHTPTELQQQSALMLASRRGHADCVLLLLEHGVNVHQRAADGSTALTAALAMGQATVLQLLLAHGAGADAGADEWMGMGRNTVAEAAHDRKTAVLNVLRAYESHFAGNILQEQGCACVASWPGIYAARW